jgi:hypothetical protein
MRSSPTRTFAWRRLVALQPPRYYGRECNLREEMAMTRAYNVVDATGHILEPLNLWDDYIDPATLDPMRRTR